MNVAYCQSRGSIKEQFATYRARVVALVLPNILPLFSRAKTAPKVHQNTYKFPNPARTKESNNMMDWFRPVLLVEDILKLRDTIMTFQRRRTEGQPRNLEYVSVAHRRHRRKMGENYFCAAIPSQAWLANARPSIIGASISQIPSTVRSRSISLT